MCVRGRSKINRSTKKRNKNWSNIEEKSIKIDKQCTKNRSWISLGRFWEPLGGPDRNDQTNNSKFYLKSTKYNDEIRNLNSSFYNDTGLHHNDINYKNILRNDSGKLYLIDFEESSHYNTERNLDKILWTMITELHQRVSYCSTYAELTACSAMYLTTVASYP